MAQRKSLAWAELRVGLVVIVSFVLLGLAIFYIGGETSFFVRHYTVTAYFASANGLRNGAEVWLEGVPIGTVQRVAISGVADPNRAVQATLQLNQQYQNIIRTDSEVTIGTTGLLGDEHVDITRGSAAGKIVQDGGTLQGIEVGGIKKIITGTNEFIENLDVLSAQVKKVSDQIQGGQGTLGRFLTDTSVFDNMNATIKEGYQLVHDVRTGNGTIGQLISNDETLQKINDTLDRVNDIVKKTDSGQSTLGKFVNDTEAWDRFVSVEKRLESTMDRIDRGEGTLGKFLHDEAIANQTSEALKRANDLMNAAQNGDGTLGKLIKDPTLYNSFNQTTSEILKLLYDFRQDPKKFLTVNFKIF